MHLLLRRITRQTDKFLINTFALFNFSFFYYFVDKDNGLVKEGDFQFVSACHGCFLLNLLEHFAEISDIEPLTRVDPELSTCAFQHCTQRVVRRALRIIQKWFNYLRVLCLIDFNSITHQMLCDCLGKQHLAHPW
jgi:hypothetical protein